ncbi:MAG: sensor histidine kinase [Geitlerinemataceae cyanobacterium]
MAKHSPPARIQNSYPGAQASEARSFFARLYHFLPDWLVLNGLTSVRQKIGWGYAIVVGVTLASTAVGIQLDRANRRAAHERKLTAIAKQLQVERLQNQMLLVKTQTLELAERAERDEFSATEAEALLDRLEHCAHLLFGLEPLALSAGRAADETAGRGSETAGGIDSRRSGSPAPSDIPSVSSAVSPSLDTDEFRDYTVVITRYTRRLESILGSGSSSRSDEIAEDLATFIGSDEYDAFRDRAYALSEFSAQLDDLRRWLRADLERAEGLSLRIWLVGIGVSVSVTALAIFYISGIISYPLSFVTAFAQRITQESNYRLHVPKISNDEVGALTEAIDTLVRQVELDREEIRDAQTQLVQIEKMSGLGQMVAGVAHEINNPVNFIYGNLAHLDTCVRDILGIIEEYQDAYPEPVETVADLLEEVEFGYLQEDIPKQIESMRMGADRIRQIVLSLRVFSRLDESSRKRADLHAGLDSTLALLDHRLKSRVRLVKQYGDLPEIDCYPAQLNQLWMNLLANAIDALDLVFERFRHTLSEPTITVRTAASGRQATIEIRDNGIGIPEDAIDRVFDPFFTTKPIGQGTGLGLSVCFAIVERHGGQIRVRSQLDTGTKITVTLPLRRTERLGSSPDERFR